MNQLINCLESLEKCKLIHVLIHLVLETKITLKRSFWMFKFLLIRFLNQFMIWFIGCLRKLELKCELIHESICRWNKLLNRFMNWFKDCEICSWIDLGIWTSHMVHYYKYLKRDFSIIFLQVLTLSSSCFISKSFLTPKSSFPLNFYKIYMPNPLFLLQNQEFY